MSRQRLTKTQRLILGAAAQHRRGLVKFGPGDRVGTRIARYEGEDKVPVIIAYGYPAWFLKARGLLKPAGNDPNTYQVTDKGQDAVCWHRGRPT